MKSPLTTSTLEPTKKHWSLMDRWELKRIPWRLYLSVLLTNFLPTLYLTVRIYFLGDIPSAWGVNIASQLVWVSLVLEVIQEGLILPLFYIIGKTLHNPRLTRQKIRTGLILTLGIHVVVLALIGIFAPELVELMAQDPTITPATVQYIRWELIGLFFQSLYKFLTIVLILYNARRWIYVLLGLQLIMSVGLDSLFFGTFAFSLYLGVNGIAYSNILTNFILSMVALVGTRTLLSTPTIVSESASASALASESKSSADSPRFTFAWLKEWGTVGGYSALDSFIRNAFYTVFIIRMMNVLAAQGTYWLANGFIWSWLLLPVYPLATVVKQAIATTSPSSLRGILKPYYIVATGIILLWGLTLPGWTWFLTVVMNVAEPAVVLRLILVLLPAYISFVYNTVADAVFYAIGKTQSLAIQTILTNVAVYGGAYLLFHLGVFVPTLDGIALLFSTGIIVDGILTFILLRYYIQQYDRQRRLLG